jgi:hypothetical protein
VGAGIFTDRIEMFGTRLGRERLIAAAVVSTHP